MILDNYIILEMKYTDDTSKYLSNVSPVLWSSFKSDAKKFCSRDDILNQLGKDINILINYKRMYITVKGFNMIYIRNNIENEKEKFLL